MYIGEGLSPLEPRSWQMPGERFADPAFQGIHRELYIQGDLSR